MAQDNVQTVLKWVQPKTQKEGSGFIGFSNFYRHFIKDFCKLPKSRTVTTSVLFTGKNWRWSDHYEKVFTVLKQRFTTGRVLWHYDPPQPIILAMNASEFAIGMVLSTNDDSVHSVTIYSRLMTAAELNFDIYNNTILAIVCSFKECTR
jgi:hypothetical protein